MVCFFFYQKKKFCLMSGLKFTLSNETSFLPGNLSGLKKNYIQACDGIVMKILGDFGKTP